MTKTTTRAHSTPLRTVWKPLALSFVAMRDGKTLPKPTKNQLPACFWNVAGTGDYAEDCKIDEQLALEYLALEESEENGMGHLPKIVRDMPRELTGVEVGLLCTVSRAAGAGAGAPHCEEPGDIMSEHEVFLDASNLQAFLEFIDALPIKRPS